MRSNNSLVNNDDDDEEADWGEEEDEAGRPCRCFVFAEEDDAAEDVDEEIEARRV